MNILYTYTHERPGNDSWLIDKIQIIKEDNDLYLRHKIDHKGWNGGIKEVKNVDLNKYCTVKEKKKVVKQYLIDNMLFDIKIPNLKKILK